MNFCKKKVLYAIILLGKNDEICVHSNATNSPEFAPPGSFVRFGRMYYVFLKTELCSVFL